MNYGTFLICVGVFTVFCMIWIIFKRDEGAEEYKRKKEEEEAARIAKVEQGDFDSPFQEAYLKGKHWIDYYSWEMSDDLAKLPDARLLEAEEYIYEQLRRYPRWNRAAARLSEITAEKEARDRQRR